MVYIGRGSIRNGEIRGGGWGGRIGGGKRVRIDGGGGEKYKCGGCVGGGRRVEEGPGLPRISESEHYLLVNVLSNELSFICEVNCWRPW